MFWGTRTQGWGAGQGMGGARRGAQTPRGLFTSVGATLGPPGYWVLDSACALGESKERGNRCWGCFFSLGHGFWMFSGRQMGAKPTVTYQTAFLPPRGDFRWSASIETHSSVVKVLVRWQIRFTTSLSSWQKPFLPRQSLGWGAGQGCSRQRHGPGWLNLLVQQELGLSAAIGPWWGDVYHDH